MLEKVFSIHNFIVAIVMVKIKLLYDLWLLQCHQQEQTSMRKEKRIISKFLIQFGKYFMRIMISNAIKLPLSPNRISEIAGSYAF